MNSYHHLGRGLFFLFSMVLFAGCVSVPNPGQIQTEVASIDGATLENADAVYQTASNPDEVMNAVQMYESILANKTESLSAMLRLSHLHIYKGAAMETTTSGKRQAFVEAMAYAELAMMQLPAFREEIEDGAEIWEAADVLDRTYVSAIGFWSIAMFYQFDECLSKAVKPFNLKWIRRAETMLDRAYELEPGWGAGQLDFSYGIIYLMPKAAGGDMEKSKAYFDKAVDAYPEWLINRWGRARYYYKKTGEKEAQRTDLEWVLAQDLKTAPGPLFWNLYFQEQARILLED